MDILLVEDNEMVVKGLKYSLEQNNFRVTSKATISDTLEFLENEKIDLIILDISLPDGDGLKLYEKQIKPKIKP